MKLAVILTEGRHLVEAPSLPWKEPAFIQAMLKGGILPSSRYQDVIRKAKEHGVTLSMRDAGPFLKLLSSKMTAADWKHAVAQGWIDEPPVNY